MRAVAYRLIVGTLVFVSLAFGVTSAVGGVVVTNVRAHQIPDTSQVEVLYDLDGAGDDGALISVRFTADGSGPYEMVPDTGALSGDVGVGVANGSDRRIVWDAGETLPADAHGTRYRAVVDPEVVLTLPGGVTMDLIHIPAGEFTMGSPTDERGRQSDEDLHHVTLTEGYLLGQYEVTQAQWEAVMGAPADLGCYQDQTFGVGAEYPVYCVSWNDVCGGATGFDCSAESFVGRLNAHLGATELRLPTEAEWERAARAGAQSPFSFGDDPSCSVDGCVSCPLYDQYMIWCGNSEGLAAPVGSREPNDFGLYDVHGNVYELVGDWYTSHLGTADMTDPVGPPTGWYRVMRGGSHGARARYCRAADRNKTHPESGVYGTGFRVAATLGGAVSSVSAQSNVFELDLRNVAPSNVFFDDFDYGCVERGQCDTPLLGRVWTAWGNGRRLVSVEDGVLTLRVTEGLAGEGRGQGVTPEIRTSRLYHEGTYAARVRFSDFPGSTGEHVVQMFAARSPLGQVAAPHFAECGFEYLAHDFWGSGMPAMYANTWDQGRPGRRVTAKIPEALQGRWVDLVVTVNPGSSVSYAAYDTSGMPIGETYTMSSSGYAPEASSLMRIVAGLWIEKGFGELEHEYQMDLDWVLHVQDEPQWTWSDVDQLVQELRGLFIDEAVGAEGVLSGTCTVPPGGIGSSTIVVEDIDGLSELVFSLLNSSGDGAKAWMNDPFSCDVTVRIKSPSGEIVGEADLSGEQQVDVRVAPPRAGEWTLELDNSACAEDAVIDYHVYGVPMPNDLRAAFDWWPANPETDETVLFVDHSSGDPISWTWDFSDGATGSAQDPSHVFTDEGGYDVSLVASDGDSWDAVTQRLSVSEPPELNDLPEHVYVIPASAHLAGLGGAVWRSDVVLHNRGSGEAHAELFFLREGRDNSDVTGETATVAAGSSLALRDVVNAVFDETCATGAIVIGSDVPLIVTSRTFNDAPEGTYGQHIPAMPISDALHREDRARLIQLTRNARYRTNIGFANLSSREVDVEVQLYRADGSYIATREYSIRPFGFYQQNDIIGTDVDDAYAVVRGDGVFDPSFFTYASVVDNDSADPMFVRPSEASGDTPMYVPAAAHSVGIGGTDWRTDLEIHNPAETPASYTVALLERDQANPTPITVSFELETGRSVRYEDILETVFGASGGAALRIAATQGQIMVGSRTYNDAPDGTYGQFIPPRVGNAMTKVDATRLVHLSHAASELTGFRTNIGFANTVGTATSVHVDLFTGAGDHLGMVPVTLQPYEHRQVTDILGYVTTEDVEDAYAVLTTATSGSAVFTYASVVNNRSGDPVYVPGVGGRGVPGTGSIVVTLPGDVEMELAHVPAGTFMMGSPPDERGRTSSEVLHEVMLTRGYYLTKHEVTEEQWEAVGGPLYGLPARPEYPMEASWEEICGGATGSTCAPESFIGKLNSRVQSLTFRLPTEAEWERAARGGTQTRFSYGDALECDDECGFCELHDTHMWWCGNESRGIHRVGLKEPNTFGLYDMHGNVGEWVADWHEPYEPAPVTDPTGPSFGKHRVVRGGDARSDAHHCRSASRARATPGCDEGFRVVVSE